MITLERVKQLCKERGLTITKLEDKLDIPSNTIYQWKRISPSLDKLEKIADYFNVSTDYLLGRSDIKTIQPETIAAHHDGEDWTEEELEEIERFKQFIKTKRQK